MFTASGNWPLTLQGGTEGTAKADVSRLLRERSWSREPSRGVLVLCLWDKTIPEMALSIHLASSSPSC